MHHQLFSAGFVYEIRWTHLTRLSGSPKQASTLGMTIPNHFENPSLRAIAVAARPISPPFLVCRGEEEEVNI
jgi:hypothetical protein